MRELRVPDLIWEAAQAHAQDDGVPLDQALLVLVRAYAYGRLSVVPGEDGRLLVNVPVIVP